MLPIVAKARETGLKRVVVPQENGEEAAVIDGIEVLAANHLQEVIEWLNGERELDSVEPAAEGELPGRRSVCRGLLGREGAGPREAGARNRGGGRS